MEEDIDKFHEKIGLAVDPDEQALAMLKHWQEVNGIEPDPATQAALIQNAWMYKDEEIDGTYMGAPNSK